MAVGLARIVRDSMKALVKRAAGAALFLLLAGMALACNHAESLAEERVEVPGPSDHPILGDRGFTSRLSQGAMRNFRFADAPLPIDQARLGEGPKGGRWLAEHSGKLLLVAFWASWCAPCRTELPSLARLDRALRDDKFSVILVSIDKRSDEAAQALARWAVEELPSYDDPQARIAAALNVPGVPMTLLIDPNGREIGRLRGSAVWDAPEGILLVKAVLSRLNGG